jgi:ligand-binding SRPBCC domain-containing protein
VILDHIDYEIGLGLFDPLANFFVSRQLHKTFQYRQLALAQVLTPG